MKLVSFSGELEAIPVVVIERAPSGKGNII